MSAARVLQTAPDQNRSLRLLGWAAMALLRSGFLALHVMLKCVVHGPSEKIRDIFVQGLTETKTCRAAPSQR